MKLPPLFPAHIIIRFSDRNCKPICTGSGSSSAGISEKRFFDFLYRASLEEFGNSLQVAVTASVELVISDHISFNIKTDDLRTGIFCLYSQRIR